MSPKRSLFIRFEALKCAGRGSVWPQVEVVCPSSRHQAERCACEVAVDGFAGVGGNAIQLAFTCGHVVAVEIDPDRADLIRHNAGVYGVADSVQVLCDDFFAVAPTLQVGSPNTAGRV
jgi:tRNA/tmRNA/rRNA uracil-C5-methylase (TrmA/RlmC/RlmD family)